MVIEALEHNLKTEEVFKKERTASKFVTNSYGWPVLSKKKGVKVTNKVINTIKEEEG
ncbi:putative toxin-antitoxin system, antitoxin component, ribbon-helix-helix domain protein [Leptospira interrogans serovar Pyrogenes str. 200701872]|uniref:Putative toxin-antitoxin system, antitoxin component, ribbon-helix-helix domain protein n=1 Tax=Leptospira interrogans serovar Pyrogenes str. 200701872 TaxID=1193029 RepID=M7A2S9_LEPIR|nr:putative toxin-antitoxin system, antitoxin component, ribbon-helix-helix domain protein [Leptospira interrogans serovar Pyrogenes str. 200701872]